MGKLAPKMPQINPVERLDFFWNQIYQTHFGHKPDIEKLSCLITYFSGKEKLGSTESKQVTAIHFSQLKCT